MTRNKLMLSRMLLVLFVLAITSQVKAEPITLKFLFADYVGNRWTEVQKALVQEWNGTHPDIQIELISGTAGYVALDQKMQILYMSGAEVDLYENYRDWGSSLIKEGILLDLIPFMEKDGLLDEYVAEFGLDPSVVAARKEDFVEFLSSLPSFGVVDSGMLYDKQLFEEAAVAAPPVSWTWDEFETIAKKLTVELPLDGTQKQYGFLYEHNFLYQWFWQNGLRSLWSKSLDGSYTFNLDCPEGRETLDFLAGLYENGIARSAGRIDDFGKGKGAMRISQFTNLALLRDHGIQASITRRPYKREEVSFSGDGWFHLHIVRSGIPEREAAAWEFLKWRTSREIDLRVAAMVQMFPWRLSNLTSPDFLEVLETMEFRDEAILMAEYMFETGELIYRPAAPFRSGPLPYLGPYKYEAITGQISVQEAIEKTEHAFYADLVH